MIKDMILHLRHEEQLVTKLIELARRQQEALVNFNVDDLYEINQFQNDISMSFTRVENERLALIMRWFKISKAQAMRIKLSQLETAFDAEYLKAVKILKQRLKKKLIELAELNNNNRVLSNRAKNSVQDMMKSLSAGEKQVCNVQV